MKRLALTVGAVMATLLVAAPAFASGEVLPSVAVLTNRSGVSSQCSATLQKVDADHDQWDLLCGQDWNTVSDVVKVFRFNRTTGALGDLVVAWPKGVSSGGTGDMTMVFFDSTTTNCDPNGPSQQWFVVRVKAAVWGNQANPNDLTKYRGTVDMVKSVDCP